ncbi:MAG: protein-L-isoaspartate O-methyltransferase [Nitrospirales bacterium]
MEGWIIPPAKEPTKNKNDFRRERDEKVRWLLANGYLQSDRIKQAMLRVSREDFIPPMYRDYAYLEVPLPLPGERATVSCPHSYPLFYEPLGLTEGDKFLEIGLGSGYGAALAREIVGQAGLVVSIEIDHLTHEFARENLKQAGYGDVIVLQGDGGLGHPAMAPYRRICITAACSKIPPPLIEQLEMGGRLIAPIVEHPLGRNSVQNLVLHQKHETGLTREIICEVLYVSLRGLYGL